MDQLKGERAVIDGPIDVGKRIRRHLKTMVVLRDRNVSLHDAPKLGEQVNGMPGLVVHEEKIKNAPDLVRCARQRHGDVM